MSICMQTEPILNLIAKWEYNITIGIYRQMSTVELLLGSCLTPLPLPLPVSNRKKSKWHMWLQSTAMHRMRCWPLRRPAARGEIGGTHNTFISLFISRYTQHMVVVMGGEQQPDLTAHSQPAPHWGRGGQVETCRSEASLPGGQARGPVARKQEYVLF